MIEPPRWRSRSSVDREHAETAIVASLSKFEQYTALRVARKMMPQLGAAEIVRLRSGS